MSSSKLDYLEIDINVSQNSIANTPTSLKQQLYDGMSPTQIKCKEGLQLIFKSTDNSPA